MSSNPPDKNPRCWVRGLPLLAVCLLLIYVHRQIHTYITAQDPFWYVALARQVLFDRIIASDLAPGLSFISPGFPLLLAGVIKLFGPYAPYDMNLVLGIAFFISYAVLLRRLMDNPRTEAVALCTTLFVMICGYVYNAHFLLYPFRGMPIYFLIFLGYALVLRARDQAHLRLLIAGLPFVAAVAIREPAVFSAAGAALFLLLDGGWRNRAAWRRMLWFLAPLAATALALLVFGLLRDKPMNHQFQSWSERLITRPPAQLIAEVLGAAKLMTVWLLNSLTWIGLALTTAGLWRLRRNRAALCFFVVPAALFFAFYCLYVPHRRYFLTVLVLLCPIVGVGTAWVLESILRRSPARISAHATGVACALLLASLFVNTHALSPWGRDVDRDEIRAFRREMEIIAPDDAIAFHEPACRYLADALTCFTHLSLPASTQVHRSMQEGRPGFYFEPLSEGCYYEGYIDGSLGHTGVSMRNALKFYADLLPIPGDHAKTNRTFNFAEGTFAAYNVLPWSKTTVQAYHLVPHSQPTVLWLDFGERAPGPASIRINTPDETLLGEWAVPDARHIMGFAMPADHVRSGHLIITVAADQPLTSDPVIGAQSGDQYMSFPLDGARSLSTHYWLRPPFRQPLFSDAQPAVIEGEGRLSLPIPVGDGYHALSIGLVLEIRPEAPSAGGTLRIFHDEQQLLKTEFEPTLRRFNRSITIERPPNARHLDLRLASDIKPPVQLRIVKIIIGADDWDE